MENTHCGWRCPLLGRGQQSVIFWAALNLTGKSIDTSNNTNEKGQSIAAPVPTIDKSCKDIFGRAVRTQIYQRNKDCKEPYYMEAEKNPLNLGQPSRQECVYKDHAS